MDIANLTPFVSILITCIGHLVESPYPLRLFFLVNIHYRLKFKFSYVYYVLFIRFDQGSYFNVFENDLFDQLSKGLLVFHLSAQLMLAQLFVSFLGVGLFGLETS